MRKSNNCHDSERESSADQNNFGVQVQAGFVDRQAGRQTGTSRSSRNDRPKTSSQTGKVQNGKNFKLLNLSTKSFILVLLKWQSGNI